jgi:hypothetical protein
MKKITERFATLNSLYVYWLTAFEISMPRNASESPKNIELLLLVNQYR